GRVGAPSRAPQEVLSSSHYSAKALTRGGAGYGPAVVSGLLGSLALSFSTAAAHAHSERASGACWDGLARTGYSAACALPPSGRPISAHRVVSAATRRSMSASPW